MTQYTRPLQIALAVAIALASARVAAQQQLPTPRNSTSPDDDRAFVFYVGDQLMYDDNLFRLPAAAQRDPSQLPVEETEDYVNLLSAGVRARMHVGRQALALAARVDDVRFNNNDQLDYTGGVARLDFDWQLGNRVSGRLLGDYQRTLASYTNYRFYDRDIVDALSGELQTRIQVGPRLALLAGARSRRTDHSDGNRRSENFESDSGTAGIELALSNTDRIILEYRYLEGDFPDTFVPGSPEARDRSYEETLANLRLQYELTSKLHLRGNVGKLEREYPAESLADDYSGVIWKATLDWEPRRKLGFELSAWRDLKAYVDSESNYFEAVGASLGPTWKPTEKLDLALEYIYEEQDYIGSPTLSSLPGDPSFEQDPGRRDEIDVARFRASYSPREFIELDLTLAYIDRSSNRPSRVYDAQAASFGIRVVF